MNKLFEISSEEKNRILSIHESVAKKQYLNEDAISDFEAKLPQSTKDKFFKMKLAWEGSGTNEQGIVDVLNTFTGAEYNLYNQYLALKKPEGVTQFAGIINAEMGYDNIDEVKKIVDALKRFGLTGTYQTVDKDKYNNKLAKPYYKTNTFKITKGSAPIDTKTDVKKPAVVDSKKDYQQKRQQITQQTQNTTKEIQKLLGQTQTGNLDSLNVEKMIDLLS